MVFVFNSYHSQKFVKPLQFTKPLLLSKSLGLNALIYRVKEQLNCTNTMFSDQCSDISGNGLAESHFEN